MNRSISSTIKLGPANITETVAGSFLSLIFLMSVSLYYLDKSETLKYFQYLLPILGLFVSMHNLHKVWHIAGDTAKLCNVFIVLFIINLFVVLSRGVFYLKFLQEGFLFIGALIFSITLIGNYINSLPKLINNIFYVLVLVFIIDKSDELLNVILNPQAIILGFISSNVATESSLSFYFAALSFYFVIEKDKKRAIWAIVFTVLSFKRIACTGFIVALVLYYSSNILNIKYNRKLFSLMLSGVNFFYLWSLILLVDGEFDETISNLFGVSSNFLFMGRVDMYTNIFSKLGYFNAFGIGIGRISDFLSNYNDSGIGEGILTNIHSDVLKYYLELGVVAFVFFMYNLIYFSSRNIASFCFMVMLNVIFLTDNVSIYFGFMVLFYLINYKISHNNGLSMIKKKYTV